MKQPAVYMMASGRNGTLYIGVTSNLPRRAWQHKEGSIKGFAQKYHCQILVYYEAYETMEEAIMREKQLKDRSRKHKLMLSESLNPDWNDLYETLI